MSPCTAMICNEKRVNLFFKYKVSYVS